MGISTPAGQVTVLHPCFPCRSKHAGVFNIWWACQGLPAKVSLAVLALPGGYANWKSWEELGAWPAYRKNIVKREEFHFPGVGTVPPVLAKTL